MIWISKKRLDSVVSRILLHLEIERMAGRGDGNDRLSLGTSMYS